MSTRIIDTLMSARYEKVAIEMVGSRYSKAWKIDILKPYPTTVYMHSLSPAPNKLVGARSSGLQFRLWSPRTEHSPPMGSVRMRWKIR
jgi:hypothetical protein